MKLKRLLLIIMAVIFSSGVLAGCIDKGPDDGDDTPPAAKTGPGYTNERDKYFYGINESMQTWTYTMDAGNTPEMTAKLAGVLGLSSYRFRMELGSGEGAVQLATGSNKVVLGDKVAEFHRYLKLLSDEGITNIMGQSTYFLKPRGYSDNGTINYPAPDSPYYDAFLDMIEETYALVAKEFPEIKYWEAGNETNMDYFMKPVNGTFTLMQKAQVTTDVMYYANKGMKRGNPNAVSVMPGLVFDAQSPIFLGYIYDNILSGSYPSGGSDLGKNDKNSDNYFDVLNWHPYNFFTSNVSDTSNFMVLNNALYDVVRENGDDGKKVHLTEFGYSNTYDNSVAKDDMEVTQGPRLVAALQAIWDKLPFVETVFLFRMFDWEEAHWKLDDIEEFGVAEVGFGMFTSPGYRESANSSIIVGDGPRPKALCIEYFKHRFGQSADLAPLYQFYRGTI